MIRGDHQLNSTPELQNLIAAIASSVDSRHGPVILQVAGVTEQDSTGDIARKLAGGLQGLLARRCCLLELLEGGRGRLVPVGNGSILELSEAEFGGLIAGRLGDFAAECAGTFEIIVVNSGAVLVSPNSILTAEQADGVILVLASERTKMSDAKVARAILENAGANLLGVVVIGRRHRLDRWLHPLRAWLRI